MGKPPIKTDDFRTAIWPIIFIGQFFTLFPVSGLFSGDVKRLQFRWVSLRTFYSYTFLFLGALAILAQIHHIIRTSVSAGAIIEDAMHMVAVVRSNEKFQFACTNETNFWKLFYNREHVKVFAYMNYHIMMVLVIEFAHKVYLFMWTFMDLFITLVSLSLSIRFEQLYFRIAPHKGKLLPDAYWVEIRHHYIKISKLVEFMDRELSPMVIVTCGSDIYFIAYQLYMSVQMDASVFSTVYFRFSLLFLILRALLMLVTSSHVYVASRKPLEILRSVPMCSWNNNVRRFTNEILNIDSALSGHKFFFLKRGLILAMTGTLITYELVMMSEVKPRNTGNFCEQPNRLF
ncbi:gustatory receptor for sugar taste 64b-like [Uranotaenia lowii]|uniref:gustatory receptor for sugar taste 64b-like n=1 Tax=Uranotaenia lowii TaxID=190385 RepID=UPI0024795F83|nr:gustatory receptor for sugar taste 64b-like [Uranotaenia lowii]